MIRKLRCLIKGHRFLMRYDATKSIYHAKPDDLCEHCHTCRGNP